MKRIFLSLGLMLAASTLTHCANDQAAEAVQPTVDGVPVQIIATLPETRTEITYGNNAYNVAWKTGDNIYISTADGTWGGNTNTNTPKAYAYDGTSFQAPEDNTIAAGTYTFQAVYTNTAQGKYATTNKLSENQTQDCAAPMAHLAENDCLIGSAEVTIPDAQPSFSMKRIYSWMKISVVNGTGAAATVQSLQFSSNANLAGIYTLDFATGEATYKSGGMNAIDVTLENATPVAAGAAQDVYFVMAPHTYNGEATITVTDIDGNTYTQTKTINTTFAAANAYNATFEMNQTTLVQPTVYDLVTTDGGIVDGGEYIFGIKSGVANDYYFLVPGTTSANVSELNELIVAADGTISTGNPKYTWTATASGNGFTFRNADDTFIYYSGSGTNLVTENKTASVWIPTFLATGHYKFQYQNTTGRFWGINATLAAFKAYANQNFINQFSPASALKQNCGAISVFKKRTN